MSLCARGEGDEVRYLVLVLVILQMFAFEVIGYTCQLLLSNSDVCHRDLKHEMYDAVRRLLF